MVTEALCTATVYHGLGNHLTVIEEAGQTNRFLLLIWVTIGLFDVAIPAGKVAAASFLLALHQNTRRL